MIVFLWYNVILLSYIICQQNCKIYLCGTKYDLVQSDKKLRQVDYHTTTDYAEGM